MKRPQIGLFGDKPAFDLSAVYAEAAALAERLPKGLRFGTSSYYFPGWTGIVWSELRSKSELSQEGLIEYAQHPLLRTVGLDRSFYAPIPEADLRRYANQLPEGFPCCCKAPSSVVSATIDGRKNPDFLSSQRFMDELGTRLQTVFRDHTGPVLIELPPLTQQLPVGDILSKLNRFLGDIRGLPLAVELRDRRLLHPDYGAILHQHGVGHVYNYWSDMPLPAAQARTAPLNAPFVVVRLLLRPGTTYEEQRVKFFPFTKLVEPDTRMREHVLALIREGARLSKDVYVLINNKAEGCSPLTVMELARLAATPSPST